MREPGASVPAGPEEAGDAPKAGDAAIGAALVIGDDPPDPCLTGDQGNGGRGDHDGRP
jgi:hypothetical protein